MKRLLISLCVWGLIAAAVLVTAQDEDSLTESQHELLAYILDAYDNLDHLDSYAILHHNTTTETVIDDDGDTDSFHIEMSSYTRAQFDADGGLVMAHGIDETNSRTTEFIVIDNLAYVREELSPADKLGLTAEEIADMSELWTVISYDNLVSLTNLDYGAAALGVQQMTMPMISAGSDGHFRVAGFQPLPLDVATILSIEELESESMDGQVMHVFELTIDPYPEIWGYPDESEDSETLDGETYRALQLLFRDLYQIRLWVWIGEDDHLPHQLTGISQGAYNDRDVREAIPALKDSDEWADDMGFISDNEASMTYTDFNVPFTVKTPTYTLNLMDAFR